MSDKIVADQSRQLLNNLLAQIREFEKKAASISKKLVTDVELIREFALRAVLKHGSASFQVMVDERKSIEQLMSEAPNLKVSRNVVTSASPDIGNSLLTRNLSLVSMVEMFTGKYVSATVRDQFAIHQAFPELQKIVPIATCEKQIILHRGYENRESFPVLNMPDGSARFTLQSLPLEPSTLFLIVVN